MQLPHNIDEILGLDLAATVAAYTKALDEHRFTVNIPRPTSHPLVEQIVAAGGFFEILPAPPEPDPIPPVSAPGPSELPELPVPPIVVTMAQARIALQQAGLLSLVQTMLESLPEPSRTTALTAWEYSPSISRDGMFVTTLSSTLGLSESQLDALFQAAAEIKL